MLTSKLELLVDFGATPDEKLLVKTLNELKSQDGVKEAVYKDGAIIVETTLPSSKVVDLVARTAERRVVLQGFGETQSAVAMISSQSCCGAGVMGVVRLQQTTEGPLVADGTVHGLAPGLHGLHVHESGDLSDGCNSLGRHYDPPGAGAGAGAGARSCHGDVTDVPPARHAGDLGNIAADETGAASFRILDNVLKIHEIIGRSLAITERCDDLGRGNSPTSKIDGNSGPPVACGIIARAAGVFQNPKRVCACDGVVVWDERDRPVAGWGRRAPEKDKEHKGCCGKRDKENSEQNVKPSCKV